MVTHKVRLAQAVVLAGVAAILLNASPADAQTTLRWKFKAGEKITYVMDQNTVSKGSFMGMDIETKMSQTSEMTWAIKSVSTDGVAEMTQTIDRLRMKMETPIGEFEFDSKDPKPIEGQFGELLGPILSMMAGAEMTLKMDPNGEVHDVKLPEKLAESLRSNQILAQFGGMFSEDGIKQLAQGGSGGLGGFPKKNVSKGETWDKKVEMKIPFGTIAVTTTSTYAGSETRDGAKLEKIDLKVVQNIEPAPDSMFTIKIGSQDSKGAAYFNNTTGRLVSQELKQKVKMEIEVMGNVFEQDAETTVSVKLAPGEAKKTNG